MDGFVRKRDWRRERGEGGDDDTGIGIERPGLQRGNRLQPRAERRLVIGKLGREFENAGREGLGTVLLYV